MEKAYVIVRVESISGSFIDERKNICAFLDSKVAESHCSTLNAQSTSNSVYFDTEEIELIK